ncbi:hypothetical protein BAY61_24745 [Prauserella marina]|uniref:Catechol 2,3-dioxygenase n=1 Tax=Prauserella marina TaxID=530584 RepID=A0A222VUS2_9PSEU|nr:VOC family protein [Prauserella marina]ASR37679.1 hypothetical protein BAY61_24745 [Prauserella marina]PWV75607.1 catechol 2,3-dioxygenase-like lactoylglutathione lyase family enzyme [Prauserella marina]SDD30713.1 Catechol 2,3-dioxygenase [Prauserella marina]
MLLNIADIYHTGFVVPDLDAARRDLTAVFGVTWTDVEQHEIPVTTPEGPVTANLRFAYSQGGSPRLELLEPVPGTIWEAPSVSFGPGGAHHVGVWAEDFAATSAKLEADGFPRVLTSDDGSGQAFRFAYHRLPSGPLIEIVDAARKAELEAWFEGADYPAPRSENGATDDR